MLIFQQSWEAIYIWKPSVLPRKEDHHRDFLCWSPTLPTLQFWTDLKLGKLTYNHLRSSVKWLIECPIFLHILVPFLLVIRAYSLGLPALLLSVANPIPIRMSVNQLRTLIRLSILQVCRFWLLTSLVVLYSLAPNEICKRSGCKGRTLRPSSGSRQTNKWTDRSGKEVNNIIWVYDREDSGGCASCGWFCWWMRKLELRTLRLHKRPEDRVDRASIAQLQSCIHEIHWYYH
jgi:hypothetical protein